MKPVGRLAVLFVALLAPAPPALADGHLAVEFDPASSWTMQGEGLTIALRLTNHGSTSREFGLSTNASSDLNPSFDAGPHVVEPGQMVRRYLYVRTWNASMQDIEITVQDQDGVVAQDSVRFMVYTPFRYLVRPENVSGGAGEPILARFITQSYDPAQDYFVNVTRAPDGWSWSIDQSQDGLEASRHIDITLIPATTANGTYNMSIEVRHPRFDAAPVKEYAQIEVRGSPKALLPVPTPHGDCFDACPVTQGPLPLPGPADDPGGPAAPDPAAPGEEWVLGVLVGSGTLAVGAVGAVAIDRRWPGALVPLYARIFGRRILDHPVRGRMLAEVRAAPGLTVADLQRRLDLANGAVAHHLGTLERTRHVVSLRDGAQRRVYPIEDVKGARPSLAARVAELLAARGPMQAAAVARDLGLSRQSLHYHLPALERTGAIRLEKRGRDTYLLPGDGVPATGQAEA